MRHIYQEIKSYLREHRHPVLDEETARINCAPLTDIHGNRVSLAIVSKAKP